MNDDDLSKLHDRWHGEICELIERENVDVDAAAESMLTVSTAHLMRVHGARYVATRLAVVAGMLTALADSKAAENDADPRTRH